MTNKRKSIDELRDLGDAIDESILGASDAEVSEELASLGIDPEKVAAEMDAIAQEAKRMAGKSRLTNAKDAVNTFRSNRPNTSHADRSTLAIQVPEDAVGKARRERRHDDDGGAPGQAALSERRRRGSRRS